MISEYVIVPSEVAAVLDLVGVDDPARGPMHGLSTLTAALVWLTVQTHRTMPAADYAAAVGNIRAELAIACLMLSGEDPSGTLREIRAAVGL